MTQENRELLLVDLCARLIYEVKGRVYAEVSDGKYDINGDMIFYDAPFDVILDGINVSTEEIHVVAIGNEDTVEFLEIQQTDGAPYTISEFKPYLRPMSSMTEEEKEELYQYYCREIADNLNTPNLTWEIRCCVSNSFGTDWLNKHHFDYRGLIPMGLALEASKDIYDIKS